LEYIVITHSYDMCVMNLLQHAFRNRNAKRNSHSVQLGYDVMFALFLARQPPVGQGFLIHEVSRSHTTTHHNRQHSSGRVISSSQRPLLDNTQHSQHTSIPPPRGISTYNLSRRAAIDYVLDRAATGTGMMSCNIVLCRYKRVLF
jgi:hypothetical protein